MLLDMFDVDVGELGPVFVDVRVHQCFCGDEFGVEFFVEHGFVYFDGDDYPLSSFFLEGL